MPDVTIDSDVLAGLHAQITGLGRQLELQGSLNVDKVGRDLVLAVHEGIQVIKFAMSRMSAQEIHAWPADALEGFANHVSALPQGSIGDQLDHASWIEDVQSFVREIRDYDRRRSRFEVVHSLEEIPRGLSLLYMAHPVAGDPVGNCARAKRWLAWLRREDQRHTISAPWIPAIEAESMSAADEEKHRDRGMHDNRISLLRMDGIVLVGGALTKGMAWEKGLMRELGRPCVDLLHLGAEPPED